MSIRIDDATVIAEGTRILDSVSVDVPSGAVTGILGPNGAGKSTLLRAVAGLLPLTSGLVLLDGTSVHSMPRRDIAQRMALLEQSAELAGELSVLETVLLGRIPHRRGFLGGFDSPADRDLARQALRTVNAEQFVDRSWHSLSGGERQRVNIARALAQQPQILLMDEPTNHLDVSAQLSILEQVRRLSLTSVIAIHDLNLAAAFCDRLVMLSQGGLVAAGEPQDVLTADRIAAVYGADCDVIEHPRTGRPLVVYAMGAARIPAAYPSS